MLITGAGLTLALRDFDPWTAIVGGAVIGCGIAVTHYTGMLALQLPGWVTWSPNLVIASIALAIIFGGVALVVAVYALALIFALGGIYVAMEETLEASFCAELVSEEHHGMAFGALATINGVGDFASSNIVGLLWTTFGTTVAFGYSAAMCVMGAALLLVQRTRG